MQPHLRGASGRLHLRIRGAIVASLALATLIALAPPTASADPIDASLAATLNLLSGRHEVGSGVSDRLTLAPLPLAEFELRYGNESVRVEGLPAVTIRFGNGGTDNALATQLSILNGTYRHAFAGGWFVGAGQTVYNQATTYAPSPFDPNLQYSRVTGPRFEIGRIATFGRTTTEVRLAANPVMHGVQYSRVPYDTLAIPANVTYADPENASQIDVEARAAYRLTKHGEVLYGVRYINYVAHYVGDPGALADRNVGFAPVIGYRQRL
jgi:hypothetical protein